MKIPLPLTFENFGPGAHNTVTKYSSFGELRDEDSAAFVRKRIELVTIVAVDDEFSQLRLGS